MSVIGSEEYHELSCDPCSGKGASLAAAKYCPVCDELLCQGCVGVHLRNIVLKDHPLNDDVSASFKRKRIHPLALCDKHKTEKVEQYCETHNVLCCDKCRLVSHKSCMITVIKKKSQLDNQSKLMQDSLQLIQTLQRNVKRIKAFHEEGIESLKINKDQCFTEVRALKKEVDDLFVTLEKEVLDEVVKTEASIKAKLDNQIAEAENIFQQLHDCKGLLEDCHSTRDNELMFIGLEKSRDDIEKMTKLVAELQDISISANLQFEAQKEVTNMKGVLKRLGVVKSGRSMGDTAQATGAPDDKSVTSTGNISQSAGGRNTANMLSVTVVSQMPLDVNSYSINGSTFLESGDLVLCDRHNNKLLLFGPDLKLKNDLKLSGKPFDVAVITEGLLVVTIPDDKRLQFVDMTSALMKSNKVKCKAKCWGISSTQSQLYVVIDSDYLVKPEIAVLGHDGQQVRTINLSGIGIKDPCYIAMNKQGDKLYVSDSDRYTGTNSISCLEARSGTVLFRYSSKTLKEPRGLYVDGNNNLLVCGRGSHNITVVTADGRHGRILLSAADGLNQPQSVTFRPRDGALVVGMYHASPACCVFRLKSK